MKQLDWTNEHQTEYDKCFAPFYIRTSSLIVILMKCVLLFQLYMWCRGRQAGWILFLCGVQFWQPEHSQEWPKQMLFGLYNNINIAVTGHWAYRYSCIFGDAFKGIPIQPHKIIINTRENILNAFTIVKERKEKKLMTFASAVFVLSFFPSPSTAPHAHKSRHRLLNLACVFSRPTHVQAEWKRSRCVTKRTRWELQG